MYCHFSPYNTFVARSPMFSFVPMCAVRDSPIATDTNSAPKTEVSIVVCCFREPLHECSVHEDKEACAQTARALLPSMVTVDI
jgi:hypothetical protein